MNKIIILTFILALLQSCGSSNNDTNTNDPNKAISDPSKQEEDINTPPISDSPTDSLKHLSEQCNLSKPAKLIGEKVVPIVKFNKIGTELSIDITDGTSQKTEAAKPYRVDYE